MAHMYDSQDFARSFGDALARFLRDKQITQTNAAKELGLGKGGKARLNAYCHDSPGRTRPKPNAEILYLLCTKLDFGFEYNGYKISATTINGSNGGATEKPPEQLLIEFDGQINLTDESGTVSISIRQPARRVEVVFALKGAS